MATRHRVRQTTRDFRTAFAFAVFRIEERIGERYCMQVYAGAVLGIAGLPSHTSMSRISTRWLGKHGLIERIIGRTCCSKKPEQRRWTWQEQVIRALDVPDLQSADLLESQVASTVPLRRGLEGGALIYGEHLFAKVSTNFLPPAAEE